VSALRRELGAITLFVESVGRSKEFDGRAFAVEPIHEDEDAVAFRFENVTLNLLRRPAANELVEPASVAAAGGGASFCRPSTSTMPTRPAAS
jgi:hypothetical protein